MTSLTVVTVKVVVIVDLPLGMLAVWAEKEGELQTGNLATPKDIWLGKLLFELKGMTVGSMVRVRWNVVWKRMSGMKPRRMNRGGVNGGEVIRRGVD